MRATAELKLALCPVDTCPIQGHCIASQFPVGVALMHSCNRNARPEQMSAMTSTTVSATRDTEARTTDTMLVFDCR